MSVLLFTLVILVATFFAGLLGALTGLGGGIIVIPLLTIVFNVDMHYAIGTSLVAVIATSSGAAAAYVKEGITNIRLGMFLEIATTIGAVCGTILLIYVPVPTLSVIFGLVLIFSAIMTIRKKTDHVEQAPKSKLAMLLKLNSSYPTKEGRVNYTIRHVPAGFIMMIGAGMLSSLLGIGSGAFKVLAMDNIMRIPFKVSTTTSNFMIGVTAAAGAVTYFQRGYINPSLTFPVVIGVLVGATTGAKILIGSETKVIRIVFCAVITVLAIEMIYNGLHGGAR
jgi:uncharacterized membrane protein YfcA